MPVRLNLLLIGLLLCLNWTCTMCTKTSGAGHGAPLQNLKKNIEQKVQEFFTTTQSSVVASSNCLKIECQFVCFGGKATSLAADINATQELADAHPCKKIEQLRLYSYDFPKNTIKKGFLDEYSNRIERIYIASSFVVDVEEGAFANGIFIEIVLEDLRLTELRKGFFANISSHFETLAVFQRSKAIPTIHADFLDHVKFQIKVLQLQIGIMCIRNLTASSNLLNELTYADFSYNNFGDRFTETTFAQLSMVNELDLSHSNITFLPAYVFAGMTSTLLLLDLSHNHLTTLSLAHFGGRAPLPEFRMGLHNNDWHCTCGLYNDLIYFYNNQYTKKVYCVSPEIYEGWSVFDKRLCSEVPEETTTPSCFKCASGGGGSDDTTAQVYESKPPAPPDMRTTTQGILPVPTTDYDIVVLECLPLSEQRVTNYQSVKRPTVYFDVVTGIENAEVTVHSDALKDNHGLLWFHNVTKQYYYMEINYKDYGLGCYGAISYKTTVDQLVPNECYIFCVVEQDELTMSPFNCKSVHIEGNLEVNSWTTNDEAVTHIALIIFGVITCVFLGIGGIYLLLKHKPNLLKGNERVLINKTNPDEILVYPKDKTVEDFKQKEQALGKRCSRGTMSCSLRRSSTDSEASYQSYMNGNLYETIPAYLRFEDSYPELPKSPKPPMPPAKVSNEMRSQNIVSYAEIPYRPRRTTVDPLPDLPQMKTLHGLEKTDDVLHDDDLYSHIRI